MRVILVMRNKSADVERIGEIVWKNGKFMVKPAEPESDYLTIESNRKELEKLRQELISYPYDLAYASMECLAVRYSGSYFWVRFEPDYDPDKATRQERDSLAGKQRGLTSKLEQDSRVGTPRVIAFRLNDDMEVERIGDIVWKNWLIVRPEPAEDKHEARENARIMFKLRRELLPIPFRIAYASMECLSARYSGPRFWVRFEPDYVLE